MHEIEKQNFHLNALWDARHEFTNLEDIEKILKTFLLTAMGTLGITCGFVYLIDKEKKKGQMVYRGLEPDDIERFQNNLPGIIQYYFPDSFQKSAASPLEVHIISQESIDNDPFCPHQISIMFRCLIDKAYFGLAGFGVKILSETYGTKDIDFLLSLTNSLMFSIINIRSSSMIRQLRFDLKERKNQLEKALEQAGDIRKDLDRRLFHLTSFYDITHELRSLKDVDKIIVTFLLMVMGVLSANQGYILLFDKENKTVRTAYRGIKKDNIKKLSQNEIENNIIKFSHYTKDNNLIPTNAIILSHKIFPFDDLCHMDVGTGILFSINETHTGVMGLGNKITQQSYTHDDHELLLTLVNNFMVFLENTNSFETIQKLNVDLENRNKELSETIEDLTASKHKIEILESAKTRIKSAFHRELRKTGQVSTIDILLISIIGFLLGFLFNISNPSGINFIPQNWLRETPLQIDVHTAKSKYDYETAIFVDARPHEFFNQRHIKKAVNLPLPLFDFIYMMKFGNISPQTEIIVYGRNISRLYDEEVVYKLTSRGHQNVKVLAGGLSSWKKNSYPYEP